MRVVEEIAIPGGKLTIFMWNQKYLLKYETAELEQVYKIPETEVPNLEALKSAALGSVLHKITQQFAFMDVALDELYDQL